jgi:hypothetical protein
LALGFALCTAALTAGCASSSTSGLGDGGPGGASTGGAAGGATGGLTAGSGGRPGVGGAGSGGRPGAGDAGSGGAPSGIGGAGSGGSAAQGNPPGVAALFPPPGGTGLCPDAPLRITFAGAPTLGTAGRIQVFNLAQPGSAAATVDMAVATTSQTIGGLTGINVPRSVFVEGNAAVIYLPSRALAYGQTYYVSVESGAIRPPGGAPLAVTDNSLWRFSTASGPPASLGSIAVALDGTAPFCSVQGALDAVPANNTSAVSITLAAGTYHEIVYFRSKNNVTLRGQDRQLSIIAATNNNTLNGSTQRRALVGADSSSGLVVQNLTIHNLTPQDGSQAEALRLQGCDKCVVRDADILSLQDTLLWSGRVYADNCLIAGNVDFVWGTGVGYFNNCEIRTVGRSGANVQARNSTPGYGYVFVDSRLTSDPGISGNVLARIDASVYPGSHVAYINCQLGPHISAAGWTVTGGVVPATLRFWEYQSHDPAGDPIDVSGRLGGVQIDAAQAAMMRDPTVVLNGWQPPS